MISIDDVYGGTQRYFRTMAKPVSVLVYFRTVSLTALFNQTYNMDFTFLDFNEEGSLEAAITPKTKLVWLETPTNPTLKVTDIKKVCDQAHAKGLTVVVDNTFMSPYFQNPLTLGADIVLHR